MRKTMISLGAFVLAFAFAAASLSFSPSTASAKPSNSSILEESALPYYAKSVKASKRMSVAAGQARKFCKRLIGSEDPVQQARLKKRASLAVETAYGHSLVRYELYTLGLERTDTRKEKKAKTKAESGITLSTGIFSEAISVCNTAGLDLKPEWFRGNRQQ